MLERLPEYFIVAFFILLINYVIVVMPNKIEDVPFNTLDTLKEECQVLKVEKYFFENLQSNQYLVTYQCEKGK